MPLKIMKTPNRYDWYTRWIQGMLSKGTASIKAIPQKADSYVSGSYRLRSPTSSRWLAGYIDEHEVRDGAPTVMQTAASTTALAQRLRMREFHCLKLYLLPRTDLLGNMV